MAKTILGVLSLLVIMSCSIPVKENTVQPNIMETNKKNLGNLLALYPKPMTVVGAEVEGKVKCFRYQLRCCRLAFARTTASDGQFRYDVRSRWRGLYPAEYRLSPGSAC